MPRRAPLIRLEPVVEATLHQLVRAPSTPQALAQRSRIILGAAAGESNQTIAAKLGLPAITVGKWRRAFATRGLDGLQDAPRTGRPAKHGQDVWARVQQRVCQQPAVYSRWTVRTLGAIWACRPRRSIEMLTASHLQPHRVRTFTFSPDPDFETKLLDIVGLYLHPPDNALVLCVDEKTGIQALDRHAARPAASGQASAGRGPTNTCGMAPKPCSRPSTSRVGEWLGHVKNPPHIGQFPRVHE